ncbi:MAG: hypothetical protein HZB24_07670 [Desulfobacterales bacterium]|nr:hypothetical protein [Desulfobacterales bacterium]
MKSINVCKDHDPLKKERDHAQALAVCKLVLRYLPEFHSKPEELRMFPKTLVAEVLQALDHHR